MTTDPTASLREHLLDLLRGGGVGPGEAGRAVGVGGDGPEGRPGRQPREDRVNAGGSVAGGGAGGGEPFAGRRSPMSCGDRVRLASGGVVLGVVLAPARAGAGTQARSASDGTLGRTQLSYGTLV